MTVKKYLSEYPELVKEWHPTKNGDLTPEDFTHGSQQKVWWRCPKGHSYYSVIHGRTKKKQPHGCPHCQHQSSDSEIRILAELKWFFDEVNSRYKVDGVEIDVYLPNQKLGIEFDGKYWHRDREGRDLRKNKFLLSRGINLIRVRHHPLKPLSDNDVIIRNNLIVKKDLDEVLKKLFPLVDSALKGKINAYIDKPSFVNEELFKKYRSYFPSPFPEKSLLNTHPLLSAEWDYEKNYPLRPENFTYGNENKFWWLCPKGHSYETVLKYRTNINSPTGCPYCVGKKVGKDNNLFSMFPEIAKEWHPTKNRDLTPKDVTYGSNTKVWWICDKGHDWETTPNQRTKPSGSGCPYCSGRNSLNYDLFK